MYAESAREHVLPTTAESAAAVNIWHWRGILGRLLGVNHPEQRPVATRRAAAEPA